MITIKNHKSEICDYRIPCDMNINESIENFKKLIEEYQQKIIEITGIPKNIINK